MRYEKATAKKLVDSSEQNMIKVDSIIKKKSKKSKPARKKTKSTALKRLQKYAIAVRFSRRLENSKYGLIFSLSPTVSPSPDHTGLSLEFGEMEV